MKADDRKSARGRPLTAFQCAARALMLMGCSAGLTPAEIPDGPGKAATVRVCGKCHSPEQAASLRQDRDAWEDTVSKMVKLGATGSDDDLDAVLNYLAKNFGPETAGPVNVNKATAVDLESGLRLGRTEAEAIVKYRTEKGNFRSIEDLRNVPGLDFKKIEAKKSRLIF